MKVPYATCDFAAIRREGYLYVDKTPFLPHIEDTVEKHLIFLRPRRFGKSTLLRTLECYYDANRADQFDELFGGLWIHEHPTPNKNKYLVLRLDFSPVDTTGTEAQICKSFAVIVKAAVEVFIARYDNIVPALSELDTVVRSDTDDAAAIMTQLLSKILKANEQMYLLIDEYDHFGNRLLADGKDDVYQGLVRATGFVRSFYAALKGFTTTSTIARTFITGVSPIMLDDLSSGFNIITHISQDATFNAMAGFTRSEVELALDTLLHAKPELTKDVRIGDRETLLATLERHYNGYRFSKYATERMYNSTLVLYFLGQLVKHGRYPDKMLDLNVRTDYGRLYQIARSTSEKESDTRLLLEEILTNESVNVELVEQFGTKMHVGRPQIASLFYYMGMLTFANDAAMFDDPERSKLVIPNLVMRQLQWEYMSFALMDHDGIRIDMGDLSLAMTKLSEKGEIQPLLDVFKTNVLQRLGLREHLTFNEQVMKLMLVAFLSQTKVFHLKTEMETNRGYCDLLLGVRGMRTPGKYAWIIEAKYVKSKSTRAAIAKAIERGYTQVEKYASDKDVVEMLTLGRELKAGVLLFVGLDDVQFHPWPKPAKKAATKKSAKKSAQTHAKTAPKAHAKRKNV